MVMQKVQLVGAAQSVFLQTNGVDATTIVTEIPLAQARMWGPRLAAITPHTFLDQFSSNFRWKIIFYWSVDGITWSGAVDLFSWSGTGGGVIQTPFIDATKLGLHMRYALACSPSTGTNREWGTVSAVLAFDFKI